MEIAKIITDLRKSKKWSQADFANKTGISQVMVSKYERDEAIPSIEVAIKMARAFEVSLDYLAGEGQNASFDKEMMDRLERVEKLPQEEKKRIFHFIDLIIRDHSAGQMYGKK
jgi:transcriptional regulator with XRE-family HTH domain